MTTTEAFLEGDDRNFTLNFGLQHPAAYGVLRLVLVMFAAVCFLSLSGLASAQMPPGMTGQMPSKEDVRKSLAAAGMTPDEIEDAIRSMPFPDAANETGEPCVDDNNNDICDAEENDLEITTCRKSYVNIIEKTARDSYGDYLGVNALQISQVCSMAALGGTMYEKDGAVYADVGDQYSLNPLIDYWETIRKYSVNVYGRPSPMSEVPEYINDAAIQGVITHLPPAFRDMTREGDDYRARATPVFEKCESIRQRVGNLHSRDVLDSTVCIKHLPPTIEMKELEVPSDE